MKFLRGDRDKTPDKQSYYDWHPYLGGRNSGEGLYDSHNFFKTEIEIIHFLYSNEVPLAIAKQMIMETERGWQLATPPKTLFGYNTDESFNLIDFDIISANNYLQIWEGVPVGDIYGKILTKSHNIFTDGDLFIPVKMLYCYKIIANIWDYSFAAMEQWYNNKEWSVNPFTQKAASLTRFLLADFVSKGKQVVPKTCPTMQYLIGVVSQYLGKSVEYVKTTIYNTDKWGSVLNKEGLDLETKGVYNCVTDDIKLKDLDDNGESYALLHEILHSVLFGGPNRESVEGMVDAVARDIAGQIELAVASHHYDPNVNDFLAHLSKTKMSVQSFARKLINSDWADATKLLNDLWS